MAGYVFKIVIENTHPPVWRRVMVPDRITFQELHEIIQVLFGWENCHLHEFSIPADHIRIDDTPESWGRNYRESETLIDSFVRCYKGIRYTYDFGDDWRHKIMIEKTDEEYTGRCAVLLKYKGDHFAEDCGGIWEQDSENRVVFEPAVIEQQLADMTFSKHEELQETELLKEAMDKLVDMVHRLSNMESSLFDQLVTQTLQKESEDVSVMAEKINAWKIFERNVSSKQLQLVPSNRTQKNLLLDLGDKEVADYYKYLRLPQGILLSREEKVNAIADLLREHPEYLLYVMDAKEYDEFLKWIKLPCGKIDLKLKNQNMILKLLALGLGDFSVNGDTGYLSFASDLQSVPEALDAKTRKKVYRELERFDNKIGELIVVYGVIELESLYEIYTKVSRIKIEKEDFFRYLYWHSRYNDFVDTSYTLDGTCYVSSKDLDVQRIMKKTEVYTEDLSYASYSEDEITYLAEDLSNRSEWIDILFTTLHFQMKLDIYEAQFWLFEIVSQIMNGSTISELITMLKDEIKQDWSLEIYTELWIVLSGLMLELELPMLKGRTRLMYAEEKGISPWSIGMTEVPENQTGAKEQHMYEFPADVQEWMYEASETDSDDSLEQLFLYKKKNQICSEEFLYLLAGSCITFDHTKQAEQLISELRKSSVRGKKAAKQLNTRIRERYEIVDDEEEYSWEQDMWDFMNSTPVQQPFVRETPKIGRNDPCPCGSGKKYKKCCGRNK